MAPSQLKIATSALQRLLKEEQSYYKEQEQQEARIAKLESEANGNSDGNYEYSLRQERKALDETKAMIPQMRDRITNAREKLETMLDTATDEGERAAAVETLKTAKDAQKNDPIAGGAGTAAVNGNGH